MRCKDRTRSVRKSAAEVRSVRSCARVILEALIGGIDPSQHPIGVTKNFIGQAQCGKSIWVVSFREIAPGGVEFLLCRIGGDAENDAGVVCVEAAPVVAAIGGAWLDTVVRIDARDLGLKEEGLATVFGLDPMKGPSSLSAWRRVWCAGTSIAPTSLPPKRMVKVTRNRLRLFAGSALLNIVHRRDHRNRCRLSVRFRQAYDIGGTLPKR